MGEKFLQTTGTLVPANEPVNPLAQSTQNSEQSTIQSAGTSAPQNLPAATEVPIGILEVPVGVWGSRRAVSATGQLGKTEVFDEETCTVIVFPHGAVIRLSTAVAPGQMMMIANRQSSEVVPCRVVKARHYSSVRGYAEIEFFRSTNAFWGAYTPQGIMKLTPRTSSAKSDKSFEDFWMSSLGNEAVHIPAIAAAVSDLAVQNRVTPIAANRAQRVMAPAASDLRSEAAKRKVSARSPLPSRAATNPGKLAVPSAPAHRLDDSVNERSWILELLSAMRDQVTSLPATARSASPKPSMAFAWVTALCLLLASGTGIYLRHRAASQLDAGTQSNPAPAASTDLSAANIAQTAQPENSSATPVPDLPVAKPENFPGSRDRDFAYNARSSQPPSKIPSVEQKLLSRKPLSAPVVVRHSAAALGHEAPPDLAKSDSSNIDAHAMQSVFAAFLPPGGRVKEPQVITQSAPIYPIGAKQAHIEGQVTIEAVIDITGKLTDMKVVSGEPLLQQAALDSLRTWKYAPGYLNDQPIPVKTSVIVKFRLH